MAAASSWRVAGARVPVLRLPPWLRSLEGPRRWLSLPWFEAHTPTCGLIYSGTVHLNVHGK